MRLLFDTSILVEVDRQNAKVIDILKRFVKEGKELVVSTITVTEILTGSYLRRDANAASVRAKEILNQFIWKDFDGETAEGAAKLFAFLRLENKQNQIEYPDVLIAAAFGSAHCDYLITLNKKDFALFPHLQKRVFTPEEFAKQVFKA